MKTELKPREKTRRIALGNTFIGGGDSVLIQSMCNIKTSQVEEVSAQINRCAALGAQAMRCSVLDEEDANSFGRIKERVDIPIIADIHFSSRFALLSLESGADAIRINPGNIGSEEGIRQVVELAKAKHAPIRVGVNSGSIDKSIYFGKEIVAAEALLASARKHVEILEKYDFHDIVISLKGSDAIETIEAYRLASKAFDYPLHIGVTEAGPMDIGLIRSTAGLAPLLLEGIGDTIRISLSDDPEEEVKACCRLLHDLKMYPNYPTFISCPTCGRTEVNLVPTAKAIQSYLEQIRKPITVAVMGCVVNGPGEARHADIGAAGGKGRWVVFSKGEILFECPDSEIIKRLKEEIDKR